MPRIEKVVESALDEPRFSRIFRASPLRGFFYTPYMLYLSINRRVVVWRRMVTKERRR